MSAQKVVLVSGASSGIGRATAELLAGRDYRVFGTARRPEQVSAPRGVTLLPLDVAQGASVTRAVQSVLEQAGRIDVLVNNSGAMIVGALEETSIEQAQTLFDTNVFGVIRLIQAVLPSMRDQGSGLIVNVSSVLGFLPAPYLTLYASTKHALEGLSESLDHEVRQFGVRIILVEPSFTRTGLGSHSATAAAPLPAYAAERSRAAAAVAASIDSGPAPGLVAQEIARAIETPHRIRRPAGRRAKLLSGLRRFLPAAPLDRQLRKSFGLSDG